MISRKRAYKVMRMIVGLWMQNFLEIDLTF